MGLHKAKIRALKEELPGHYDPEDDIMNRAIRVEGNLDDVLSKEKERAAHEPIPDKDVATPEGVEDNLKLTPESNLTKEDFEALGPKDLSLDMNDDEQLKHRTTPVDFTGKDLDVPGSELDDDREAIGSEDEENNNYSIGGDNHQDLEEPRP